MKSKQMYWVVSIGVLGISFFCGVPRSMAEEDLQPMRTGGTAASPLQEMHLAPFETEGDFSLGYQWVSTEDALKAAEYIYPHSSVVLGLNLLSCPLPYRFHANAEFVSKYDFYADAGFAYKDLVLFRDILVGVHHNLPHASIQFEKTPGLSFDERNGGDNYFIDYISNLSSLRLKAPDFPAHTFINHRHVERDGRVQQRFARYSFVSFTSSEPYFLKTSESRDLDWTSDAVKLGANSHLGPVEIEYAYDMAEFDPGGNFFLIDSYNYPPTDPASPFHIAEPDDTYPHHVVAETESSAHAVKVHSSYTGGIVTSATLGNLQQKNNFSGTESTTWKGAFDFSWIPEPNLGIFFKFRHTTLDMDNPDTVTLIGLSNASVNTYAVRQGISYDKNILTLSTRYKPFTILSLFANYAFSHHERKDLEEWALLPGHSNIHSIDVKAQLKPFDRLQLRAGYEYKNYQQPAYNSVPDSSNRLRLTTSYSTPSGLFNLYLEYTLFHGDRDSMSYLNSDLSVTKMDYDRKEKRNQFLTSLTTELTPTVSLTASWFFQRWKIEQDLAFGKMLDVNTFDQPYIDAGVPYADQSNSFILSLFCVPREDITVGAELGHTIAKGTTDFTDVVGGSPYSLSTFSNVKTSETSFSFDINKRLLKKWEIGLRTSSIVYNDRVSDSLDGKVFVTTFNIKRLF